MRDAVDGSAGAAWPKSLEAGKSQLAEFMSVWTLIG